MAGAHKHTAMFGSLLVTLFALGCEAASGGLVARRMAMGDMSMGSMNNLVGAKLNNSYGNVTYIIAGRDMARQAYPWCMTSTTTAYFLRPTVAAVNTTSTATYKEYMFKMDEDFGLCKDILTRKNRTKDINKLCNTPFYSFMIAVSTVCHEAVMSVNTVNMYAREDTPGAKSTEMYCHSHKGHDTGMPLLKYLIKPSYLTPSSAPGAKRSFVLTIRINKSADNMCNDLYTLCGGNTCMVALSDEEYDICPAFYSRMAM